VSRVGRRGKVHLEHPVNSLACRKACRTLHHGPQAGRTTTSLFMVRPRRGVAALPNRPTRPRSPLDSC